LADPTTWLAQFKKLHARARKDALSAAERSDYAIARNSFARALLGAQGRAVESGDEPMALLRVLQAVPVELDLAVGRRRALTADVGASGFTALLGEAPRLGEKVGFSMRLPGLVIVGRAEVTENRRQGAHERVLFRYVDLPDESRERLEAQVLDFALEGLSL
jgi:hypothetical protein